MDEERLAEIEARVAKATPGKSVLTDRGGLGYDVDVIGPDARHTDLSGDRGMFLYREDAEFYAHARQDVPDLVVEVRWLRERLDRIGAETSRMIAFCCDGRERTAGDFSTREGASDEAPNIVSRRLPGDRR